MSTIKLVRHQGAPSPLQAIAALRPSGYRPLYMRPVSQPIFSGRHRWNVDPLLPNHGRRFQSTTGTSREPGAPRKQHPDHPPLTLGRVFGAAFRSTVHSLRNVFRPKTLRDAYRKNPEEMVLALILLTAACGAGFYTIYLYFNYFYHRQFTRYPEPVAKAMRRALYYSNYAPDPPRALKYYKQALELCKELGLDPYSDDVMGIRIQLAAWLEKIENYQLSAKVLEALLSDCKHWVEVMEKAVRDGTAPKLTASPAPSAENPQDNGQTVEDSPPPETLWGKRTRVLGKAIGISVKLGELYANEHVMEQELAHEHLLWSVETGLKESRRRAVEGLKEGEGEWMSPEAIGGALESLGHSYESKSQFHLAVPLFLQALRLCQDPCHSAVIMNNLAASFAQHPTQAPFQTVATAALIEELPSPNSVSAADARKAYLETAKRWATNASMHATQTKGDQRTPECDEACAVSLCNLGDISALLGDSDEAHRMYRRCIDMSRSLGFTAGVKQAEEGLKSLTTPNPKTEGKPKSL